MSGKGAPDDDEPAASLPAARAVRRGRPLVTRGPNSGTQDAILRAAGELLDEAGYEGLSTTEVARRAGVSTATVYRHYPDKHAVLVALCFHLHQERLRDAIRYTELLATASDWRKAAAAGIREVYKLRTDRPGESSSRIALQASPELASFNHEIVGDLTHLLAGALRRRKPSMSKATADRVALICITTMSAVFQLIARKPASARALLDEAIAQRLAYLALYLD